EGAAGLAADVRYYGKWMRDEAERRIGHLYPDVDGLRPIAWLWARAVSCTNPGCGAEMPLVHSFWLSTRGERSWIAPIVEPGARTFRFEVCRGAGGPPEGTVDRRGARCLVCGRVTPLEHVRLAGQAGRMSTRMIAIVLEGPHGR